MASAVEFEPVPAMTLARPAAVLDHRGDHPLVLVVGERRRFAGRPDRAEHRRPLRDLPVDERRRRLESTSPSRNGVTSATVQPANIRSTFRKASADSASRVLCGFIDCPAGRSDHGGHAIGGQWIIHARKGSHPGQDSPTLASTSTSRPCRDAVFISRTPVPGRRRRPG